MNKFQRACIVLFQMVLSIFIVLWPRYFVFLQFDFLKQIVEAKLAQHRAKGFLVTTTYAKGNCTYVYEGCTKDYVCTLYVRYVRTYVICTYEGLCMYVMYVMYEGFDKHQAVLVKSFVGVMSSKFPLKLIHLGVLWQSDRLTPFPVIKFVRPVVWFFKIK